MESNTHFISWIKNPNDKEDGVVLIDEGVFIELPPKAKNDLIEYFKKLTEQHYKK
jgi:hypothetical protein